MNAGMIKRIQKLQKEMEQTQKEIHESTFTATANGIVSVETKGTKIVTAITYDKSAIESLDDVEMLLESVKVAVNAANAEIDKITQERMKKFTALAGM